MFFSLFTNDQRISLKLKYKVFYIIRKTIKNEINDF